MSRKIKKSVSILLALVMLCGVLAVAPVTVGATATEYTTLDGNGTYSLIPDEDSPGMYELRLVSGTFTGETWQRKVSGTWSQEGVSEWRDSNINPATIKTISANDGVEFTGDCNHMFQQSLTECERIDFSRVITTSVTSMRGMFWDCPKLKSLNIAGFDISNITRERSLLYWMFRDCPVLSELTISETFSNTEKGGIYNGVGDAMFLNNGRQNPSVPEHEGWIDSETGAVASPYTNGGGVITAPDKVTTYIWAEPEYEFIELADGNYELHLISGFYRSYSFQHGKNNDDNVAVWNFRNFEEPYSAPAKIKKITADESVVFRDNCDFMFADIFPNCTEIDLSKADASKVTSMWGTFLNCTNLTKLNLPSFNDESEVESMKNLFAGCQNLTALDVTGLKTCGTETMERMFYNCSSLTSLDFSGFVTDNVQNMESMFENCIGLEMLDLSDFKTANVTDMSGMFNGCTGLKSINVSGFNTANVNDFRWMFQNCTALESIDLSSFAKNTRTHSAMLSYTSGIKEITISDKFNGITGYEGLNNGEVLNLTQYAGWRIKGDPESRNVSGYNECAVITGEGAAPGEGETKTYIWIGYYGVDWVNWDNTKLSSEHYKAETNIHPTYKGKTPTNPDTEDTTSVFVGWVDDLGAEYGVNDVLPVVTRDTTYTAKFDVPKTSYTLNYIYQGRSGGNKGAYVGDDGDTDEKTYTVTVELGASDLEESGMPKAKVLVDNAPVVNDPYKNCRWTFTDEYVRFDPENKVVTITANQPERLYRVELKNSDNSLIYTTRVKLNSFVQKDDSFITVPETDGSGTKFAYWSVVQNGKEVARCFERRFNLRVTGDSVVTAHYGEAENLVTLSDAEISRQQFTENGTTKDLLYVDFITAYMNKQGMELSTKSSDEYKTGMIVQYSPDVKVEKENAPGETLSENDKKTFAAGDLLTAADAKTIANGGTVGGKYSYLNAPIDNAKYNDKNRLNKSLVFTNTENARRLVFCAYYYVYNVKTDEIEMTAPVYFYLYDAGNAIVEES